MCNAGEPRDFVNEYMKPYASTLVDIQYGDEGGFNRVESECFKNWFSWSKQNIPGAVVHANSWDDPSWYRDANLSYYVENAKPDLLSWDKCYWDANGGPAPSRVVMDLLNTNTWKKQREYGLKGLTGDGSSPILYGQYLDYNWDANVSASEKSIVPSLVWSPARSGSACSAWNTTATTAPRSSTTMARRRVLRVLQHPRQRHLHR